jgi:membrane peptidoglycan carboxypeptidase
VATAFTVVDLPQVPRMAEASVLYYSDGVTELARLGVQDRTPVHHSDVPLVVRRAVLAAEDRAFYDHSGISWRGVARATVSNATGDGGTQGASTITQQYVKNTYLTHERTLGRKVEEAVLSVKVERRHSKDEILQGYLNTIYFGRGAYGIDAAARTYFNTRVHDLTAEQGAVLAASIKSPLGYDPGRHRAAAEERWRYVLGTMAELGWLTPVQAQDAKYPAIAAERSPLTGPVGYIVARAEQEIAARGVTEQELRVSGFRIVTTIDRAAQAAAERAMSMAVGHAAADTRGALVQVQSGTGAILAYWGGDRGYGFLDYAQGSYPSGGVLAAFEDAAIVPPRTGAPRTRPNPRSVLALAHKAGIAPSTAGDAEVSAKDPHETTSSVLSRYPVSPVDLANGVGTLVAGGVRGRPHVVTAVQQGERTLYHQRGDGTPGETVRLGPSPGSRNAPARGPLAPPGPDVEFIGLVPHGQASSGTHSAAWSVMGLDDVVTAVWLGHDTTAPLLTRDNRPLASGLLTRDMAWASLGAGGPCAAKTGLPEGAGTVACR